MKIGHIINPVKIGKESDLFLAQPITFETMLKAKAYSKYSDNIALYAIGYPEDTEILPNGFKHLPPLTRSVLDVGEFKNKRKLPLIKDILFALKEEDIDYIVYTNVDIALMPYFYDFVFDKLATGSDSLIINKRIIQEVKNTNLMYSELGKKHPGYDCFVFRKNLLDKFILNNTCIGAILFDATILVNLFYLGNKLEILKDEHLTFHIGEDGKWQSETQNEYRDHNRKEGYSAMDKLIKQANDEEKLNELREILGWKGKKSKLSIYRKKAINKLINSLQKYK